MKIALMDDYQNVAVSLGDWKSIPNSQVTAFRDHLTDVDAIVKKLVDYDVVVVMRERTKFSRELLQRLPKLQLLVTSGPRNAAIDMNAAAELGIVVSGTSGGAAMNATGELAWGLTLSLVRHIPAENAATRLGRWETTVGNTLQGKTLGILGLGRLGSKMASYGKTFSMDVIAWSQNLTAERAAENGARLVSKEELFSLSDVLSIHLVLSDRTRGLVQTKELKLMKPTAYIINTSRGPIVDEASLIQALKSHTFAGAGLDVFDVEPLPKDNPFLKMDNVVLMPHMGYVTEEGYRSWFVEAIENIKSFADGKAIRVINKSVLEKPHRGNINK